MRKKLFYFKQIMLFFGFLLQFFVFTPKTQAQNLNLNGLWTSSAKTTIEIRQIGNTITGTVTKTSRSDRIGSTSFTGTLNGNVFNGEGFVTVDECRHLERFVPTTGTVSEDKILLSINKALRYNARTCEVIEEITDTATFTRIPATPSPKPTLSPSPSPTTASTTTPQPSEFSQADRNPNIAVKIPGYTQALVIEPPKESDFQKIPKTDFKKVYPVGTAFATPKPSTESANITGSMFIGKVGGEGELILQLPDGREVKLTDDKSAFEGEQPYLKWRDISGTGRNNVTPKKNIYIEEVDCHILLEQERRNQEDLKRLGAIRYSSDWGVDETIIIKPTGDCTYLNEGGPVRVLAKTGKATFKTPGGTTVSANNADFGIGYNAKSAISIVEVYNGSITITNQTGNSKTISAIYGSEIKQIEIDNNGVMTETIAIPLSQWQAFLASKQEKKDEAPKNTLPIVPAVAVLGLGGVIFFLYRTGKLLPLYQISSQKIAEILQKIRKEKKTD